MPTFAIAFSGHRPNRLPSDPDQLEKLSFALIAELSKLRLQGYDTLYCGMAEGADMLCYEAARSIGLHPTDWTRMRICCVLPYERHYTVSSSMNRFDAYYDLTAADSIISMAPKYSPGCFHQRNRYMVDHADVLLAIFDGNNKGGTSYTIKYAHKQGKKVILLHPFTLERTVIPCQEAHMKTPQT